MDRAGVVTVAGLRSGEALIEGTEDALLHRSELRAIGIE
jgi:hypothetical protein